MTALSEALTAAGIMTPDQRLRVLAREVVAEYNGDIASAEDAFKAALAREPDPVPLLWAMFEPYFGRAFRDLYLEVRQSSTSGKVGSSLPQGQSTGADPEAGAGSEVISAVPEGQSPHASDHPGEREVTAVMPQGHYNYASPPRPQRPSRLRHGAREAVAGRIVVKRLWEFRRVYGEPLAQVTRGRARTWLRHNQADSRFVELLIAPMTDDGMVIGDWYRDVNEVERIWRQATEYSNAAI